LALRPKRAIRWPSRKIKWPEAKIIFAPGLLIQINRGKVKKKAEDNQQMVSSAFSFLISLNPGDFLALDL
jgi:hypothetical protein